MKRILLISTLLAGTLFTACNKDGNENDCPAANSPQQGIAVGGCIPPAPGGNPCNTSCENAICTMEFATVDLRVNDAANAPVILDSFFVTDAAENIVQMPYGIAPGGCVNPGVYQIVNDAWVQGHQNTSILMRAKGYKNGAIIVDAFVTIAADCCHVKRAAGPETIVVSN